MKNHTYIYLEFFGLDGYDSTDQMPTIMCEWCESSPAVDVNHVEARGMGGSKTKDFIENLVGMCRPCHMLFEAKKISKNDLQAKHLELMKRC